MKSFLQLLVFFTSFLAFAGDPPVSVRGQSQTKLIPKWNIQVPFSQATNVGGIDALIEIGNLNLAANPGFEASTLASGWTAGSYSCSANTTNFIDGKQSFGCNLVNAATTVLSQDITPGIELTGKNLVASIWFGAVDTSWQICARVAGSNVNCQNVVDTSGNFIQYQIPFTAANGQSIGVGVVSTTASNHSYRADAGFFGYYTGTLASAFFNEIDYGAIPVTGGGSFAKGTTNYDKVTCHREGQWKECEYRYNQTGAGNNGSGDTIFTIPGGDVVDTSLVPVYTGAVNATLSQTSEIGSGPGIMWDNGGTHQTIVPVLYSTNSFRLRREILWSSVTWMASGWTQTTLTFSFKIRVPIQGWTAYIGAVPADQTDYGWTLFTPSSPNSSFTSISATSCWHMRVSENMKIRCKLTANYAASEARISIPNGLTSADTNKIATIEYAGPLIANTSTAGGMVKYALMEPNLQYLTFGTYATSSTTAFTKQNASALFNNGDTVDFRAEIPIKEWQPTQRAPSLQGAITSNSNSSIRNEHAFVTGAGVVTEFGGVDWINGNCSTAAGTGKKLCTFNSSVFANTTVICHCTAINTTTGDSCSIYVAPTSSSVGAFTASGGAANDDFELSCWGLRY